MAQAAVKDTTGYVNYVYNISARGTTEVASQLLGLSGMATNILGQLAFQTSSYLSTTEGALLSMGVIATAGFTKATQQAMEFDQALSTVGAISGKTRDEVSSLGDDAMAMSNKFGVAVSEMTQGMESLARAGVSQNNMTAILEEAMGLSKLEGLTLDTAINDLISTTNLLDTQNLDLSSSEYADAVRYQNQKITATSEAAPINAQDIIHTLEHIGGYASSTNLDQDDLYAVIAQLGSKGTKSEMAGTSLRAFISAGQKDTAQRALDRIGLSVKDLWKNDDTIMSISDMKDVLDEAMESRGYTQQEKLEFYSDFAGYKQANQIMKIDTSSVREFKEKIDHSWNMGQKINQVIGTAETHVQGLVQAGTNLLTKVGEPFLPIISTIAWTLRTGIDIINAIPGSNLIIAGGLILASVKAISTIFNKIVPQIVAAKGNIGSMGGFFGTIKKDLKESYTIIKNINNTDWIQKKSHSIESNRVTDNDRIEYWQKRTGKDLYGMTDVYRLEKFHGFKADDRRYKEHIRNQKYTRNERQEASNPPKENTKDNKIESQLDKIISIIQNLEDPNQAYNIGSLIPVINNTLTYINGSLAQINKKLQSFKDGNISGKTKIDFSDIKNHTFKVEITNATRIIPVHDVGSVAWGQQRKADREVRDFTTRGKVVVQDNLTHRGQKVKGFGNYRTKTLNLDTKYFDDAKYHELGHVLFSDDNRNRRSDKIKISKSDNKILNKSNLVASKHYKTLGNIVNEYEADLFAVGLARKRGETVSKKRLERMNLAKQVLDNHKVFDDVREEYIDAMINAVLIEDEEIQKQLNNTINEYERKKVQTAKNKSNRRKKPTLEEQKTQILKDKQSREETKIKHKAKYDANKINDVDFFTDVRGPIKDGDFASYYLTSEDISNFIDALDIDFGFDLNTTEGQKAQKLMLNQFKQVAEANIFANKNNITGGSKKSLLQKIDKELTDYMDVFRNTGAASLVMMDTDATVYSEEDLKSKLAVPSYMLPFSNYDVTKNTVRQKTANELKNVLEYGANPLLHSIKKTKVANYESLEMDFINQIAKEDEEIKRGLEQYNKEQKYSYEVGVGANKRGVLATGKAAREHLYARALNTKISKNIDIEEPTLFNEPKLMMGGINLNVSQLKSLNSAIKHTYEKQLGGNFEELKEGLEQTKAENIVLHNLDLALQVNDDEKRKKFIEDVYGRISGEKGLEKKRKKAKKHKFNRRTGLDYSDFTLDELHAIAYTSGVNITELQNRMVGKNNPQSAWSKPSEVAEAISEQHKIKLGIARKFHTNKIANYFLNNLTTEAQQQFLKEMGINQEDPVLGLVEYLTAQTKAKNKDGTYEKDADGNIIMHRKYQDTEENLNRIKQLGNIVEGDPAKLHIASGNYSNSIHGGQGVFSDPNDSVARTLILNGEEGLSGLNLHAKKVTDALLELVIHNAIEAIKEEIKSKTGEELTTKDVMKLMPNLVVPHSEKRYPHQYNRNLNSMDLEETKRYAAQTMHDNSKGNKTDYSTYGAEHKSLGHAKLIVDIEDDTPNLFTPNYETKYHGKEVEKIKNMGFSDIIRNSIYEEQRGVLRQRRAAKLTGQKAIYNGKQIDMATREEATHGRNFENTKVLDSDGNLIGFIANDHGDIREGFNWALERRRNRIYTQNRQAENFGALAYQYNLSRADIMNMELTPEQESKLKEQYESQKFVDIKQYISDYGMEAFEQLVGQMKLSNIFRYDSNGNPVQEGNVFKISVPYEEYLRRLKANLIDTSEGAQGILGFTYDSMTGESLVDIMDFESLHYSKDDIKAKILTEDIAWQKELGSLYNSLGKVDNKDPKDIAEDLLHMSKKDMTKFINAIWIYNPAMGEKIKTYVEKELEKELEKEKEKTSTQQVETDAYTPFYDMIGKVYGEELVGFFDNQTIDKILGADDSQEVLNQYMNDLITQGVIDQDMFVGGNFEEDLIDFDAIRTFHRDEEKRIQDIQEDYWSDRHEYSDYEQGVTIGDYIDPRNDVLFQYTYDPESSMLMDESLREGETVYNKNKNIHEPTELMYLHERRNKLDDLLRAANVSEIDSHREFLGIDDLIKQRTEEKAERQANKEEQFDASRNFGGFTGQQHEFFRNFDYHKAMNKYYTMYDKPIGPLMYAGAPGGLSSEDLDIVNLFSHLNENSTSGYLRAGQFTKNIQQRLDNFISPKVDTLYGRFGDRDNSDITDRLGGWSDKLTDATDTLQGFSVYLQEASELFPPLSVAVLGLETVIGTVTKINEGSQALSSFLDIGSKLKAGEQFEFLNKTFSSDNNAGKILMSVTGMVGEAVETLTTIFWEFLGPIALITAGLIAIKGALDWSYQSHQKYLKSLEEDQKEHRSKVKGLQTTNENAQERARNNRAPRQQAALDRNAQLAQTRLDNANMTRSHGAIEITRQKNDTLWGDYGIAAGLGKLQGNYESTASEYDGTSGQIRRIKEATLANPFSSDAMNQVSSYYDANQLAFGVMDEYKDELGKLYDSETSAMLKYHSNDVRGSPEFNKALDDFVEATGITRDHAKQYLDYMQTEHEVDKATQAMQAQADQISANTELKVQAIAFGGNPADVLGLNGIEAQQGAMIKAQADMIKMELSGQLWWKAVWATITTPIKLILSPLFIITDLLSAIWSFMTGNWGDAFDKAGKAGSRLNVFGEAATYWGAWAETEGTDFSAIGQSATDSYNRANYGNVEQPASGGYHPTHYIDSNQGQDRREAFTHYTNANRGSYHFMNAGGPGQDGGIQFNPLGTITGLLSSILGTLVNGLLIGGGIYGIYKLLKSDFDIKALGTGILSTIKGEGSNLLGDIFNVEGIKGGATSILGKFFNLDGIKKRVGGISGLATEDEEGNLTRYGRLVKGKEDFLANNAWGNYLGEKLMPDDFDKKKRKGMNKKDRDYLSKRYGIDISGARTANQANKMLRTELDKQGKWDEAVRDLHNNRYVGSSLKNRVTDTVSSYADPWREYLGNQYKTRKQNLKDNVNGYVGGLQEEAERYRAGDIKEEDLSTGGRILARGLDIKDQIFGKASETDFSALINNPKEFLSDPRNIEKMGKDVYSNYKDKYQKAKNDPAAQEEYDWYKEGGSMRFMDLSRENKIRAIGDKLSGIKTGMFGMNEDESVQEMLKNPERTMEILQNGLKSIQENGLMGSLGLDEDFGIGDAVKDKVSGFFEEIKEGAEEGMDDDEKGGNGGLIERAKKKLAGLFGFGKEEETPESEPTAADKDPNSLKNIIKNKDKDPKAYAKYIEMNKPDINGPPLLGNEERYGTLGGKEETDDFANMSYKERIQHMKDQAEVAKTRMGGPFIQESTPGAVEEAPSVLDLPDNLSVDNITEKFGMKKGGSVKDVISKVGGKKSNVLGKIGGKGGGVGKLAKGGIGKLAKGGIGKAVSGIGGKAIGKIGSKLASKGIAQIGSKVLGGALMATGIGAPLGLLLESPIGGALIEGAMDLGGKALGAIGGAASGLLGGIGGLLGFGKKTHYQQAGGGKGLGALGALMPGIGIAGMAAGGIGAAAGGIFGLLNGIFKSNKDIKGLNSSMDGHLDKTVKAITDKKSAQQSNKSQGGNITIQNININTADDPEAIKAMFLELLIELQEQVNPRIVSRTVSQAPSNSTTSINTTSTDSTTNTENTDSTSNTNGTNT